MNQLSYFGRSSNKMVSNQPQRFSKVCILNSVPETLRRGAVFSKGLKKRMNLGCKGLRVKRKVSASGKVQCSNSPGGKRTDVGAFPG